MKTHMRIILSLGALAAVASSAHADRGRNPLAGQPAIRHHTEMRKMRLEITPQVLVSTNQPFLISVGAGANLRFHLTDWLAIGGSFHYNALNAEAPLVGRITEALPDSYAIRSSTPATDDPTAGLRQPSKAMFRDHLIGPTSMWSAHVALTPIGGKFSLFNAAFANYDFYAMVGMGGMILGAPLSSGATSYLVRTDAAGTTSMRGTDTKIGTDVNLQPVDPFTGHRIAGVFGIGAHIFFNDFIGLNFELRDYMYKANPGGLDVSTKDNNPDGSGVLSDQDEYLVNHLYFGLGLTIMIPPTAKVSR